MNTVKRLEVRNVNCREHGVQILKDVSFEVNSGEILGIAGIAGSGQRELLEAIGRTSGAPEQVKFFITIRKTVRNVI